MHVLLTTKEQSSIVVYLKLSLKIISLPVHSKTGNDKITIIASFICEPTVKLVKLPNMLSIESLTYQPPPFHYLLLSHASLSLPVRLPLPSTSSSSLPHHRCMLLHLYPKSHHQHVALDLPLIPPHHRTRGGWGRSHNLSLTHSFSPCTTVLSFSTLSPPSLSLSSHHHPISPQPGPPPPPTTTTNKRRRWQWRKGTRGPYPASIGSWLPNLATPSRGTRSTRRSEIDVKN